MKDNFALFILSHKRADRVYTAQLLQDLNYQGKWYILIDNLDPEQEEYKQRYREHVIVFDKAEEIRTRKTDIMLNEPKEPIVVWARNKVFEIAREMGLDYFAEFDDDYHQLEIRYWDENLAQVNRVILKDINYPIELTLELLEQTQVPAVAWAQTGDFMGGTQSEGLFKKVKRKVMNAFFWNLKHVPEDMRFLGFINEDVNFYVKYGLRGHIMFTLPFFVIYQHLTQQNKGGLTEIYLEAGTYIKSFLPIMVHPAGVSLTVLGNVYPRIHHEVHWNRTVPCILSGKYRKE